MTILSPKKRTDALRVGTQIVRTSRSTAVDLSSVSAVAARTTFRMLPVDGTMESPIIAKLPRGHRMHRKFGVVYENAPAHADDLTQIAGIRTREAVLLNQQGIYLFGQIALWRHREMIEIAGELQMPVSRIVDEAWVDQARSLSHPELAASQTDLPASILRTVTLLACALLVGFFTMYMFGRQRNPPLTGVLSADITSLCVPAPSRLTAVHVKPGQEVFSGQPLLTLEKLEHLAILEEHERSVHKLEMELKRAEAQARIELEWRTGDVDRSLWDVKLQIAEQRNGTLRQRQKLAAQLSSPRSSALAKRSSVTSISSRNLLADAAPASQAGGLMFFSGSGQVTPVSVTSPMKSMPVRVAEVPRDDVFTDSPMSLTNNEAARNVPLDSQRTDSQRTDSTEVISTEASSLLSEELRLKAVRGSLPTTVREAMGVEAIKGQLEEATNRLENLKSLSREVQVSAPVYGVVGQVRYRQGDDLPNGEVMLRILHTDRRYIIVQLPTRRVTEMQAGQEVELIFPGHQEFRGQVVEVPVLADSTGQSGDTLAAVRIEPLGRLWPMVPVGSQVDVISMK